jgi:hypothetical protein
MQYNTKTRGSPSRITPHHQASPIYEENANNRSKIHSLILSRKVVDLRKVCKHYGLVQHGTKNELQVKITEFLKKNPSTEGEMISFLESQASSASQASTNAPGLSYPPPTPPPPPYLKRQREEQSYDDDEDEEIQSDEDYSESEEVPVMVMDTCSSSVPPPLKKRLVHKHAVEVVYQNDIISSSSSTRSTSYGQDRKIIDFLPSEYYTTAVPTTPTTPTTSTENTISSIDEDDKSLVGSDQGLIQKFNTMAEQYGKVKKENDQLRAQRDALFLTNNVLENKINKLREFKIAINRTVKDFVEEDI